MMIQRSWIVLLVSALMLLPMLSRADSEMALQLVDEATNKILALAKTAEQDTERGPEHYHGQVSEILNEVVDFRGFARSVMATYASARLYNSLTTDAERNEFNQRITRFADKLERILIVTYSNAVISFDSDKMNKLWIAPGSDRAPRRVTINQEIEGDTGKMHLVQYAMRELRPDVWKVTNLVVDGVNLGQVYRAQFSSEVEKAGGDLDKTIDDWGLSG